MGRRLQPFTLRHRFWLEAMESPLVTGGPASLVDLEMAARVCAIPFEAINREVPEMVRRGPCARAKLAFLWRLCRGQASVEYKRFQDYFIDHGGPPATLHAAAHVPFRGYTCFWAKVAYFSLNIQTPCPPRRASPCITKLIKNPVWMRPHE